MPPSTAAQLKDEGNAFFGKKDFVRAHEKYSEAIAIDGRNAVLYANRSACCFGMGKYLDAMRDAQQATVIDPGYAKGWSRLATAHDAALEFQKAIEAWQKAIAALPSDDASLTPAERTQKTQYVASLAESRRRLEEAAAQPFPGIVSDMSSGKLPWQVAEEMMPELMAGGRAVYSSSAYLIHFANQEWSEGIKYMKGLKKVPVEAVPDGFMIMGHPQALALITNGIMRDSRVFRIDCQDWFEKYNDQVRFESEKAKAWPSAGVDAIQQLALERLKKEGWDSLRPTLAVVVRAWIMRAICDAELRRAPHVADERLKDTLQLLHWGRQVWRDVHKDERGAIFQDTFVRGVKSIYLENLMAMHSQAADDDKPAIIDTLLQASRELIEEVENIPRPTQPNPNEPLDPGFVSSFYIYPTAQAYATAGYCFVQLAQSCADPMEKKTYNLMAMKQYADAARLIPEDDEKHCWFLQCTIQPMVSAGVPKKERMEVVKAIRAAMPKMQRIWANSSLAKQGRDTMIEMALRIGEKN